MASWLVIPVIILAATSLGSVVVLQFLPLPIWRTLEGIFASTALGVVLGGWLALVLAELGVFSLATLTVLWLVVFLLLLALAIFRKSRTEMRYQQRTAGGQSPQKTEPFGERLFVVLFVLWLFVVAWLYFRPHEYILGGADAGVYISLGAEIAQNGGFDVQDETLATMDPALRDVVLRPLTTNPVADSYLFPGFYVVDAAAGEVTPQFYPMHPVWQAVAFSLGSSTEEGVRSELLISGLWMALAAVAIILTARELGGWRAALLVMAALALAALQVWFARYPTTEALSQFLLWSGLWALIRWLGGEKPAALWALVAGSTLGAVFLVRIDILVLLPVFVILGVGLWLRGWRRSDWWFAIPFALLVLHSLFHGALFSAPYFSEHIGFGLRLLWVNWWILALALIGGALALWLLSRFRSHYSDLLRYRSAFLLTIIGAFLVYAVYGWFVRPVILETFLRPDSYSESLLPITNHENWRRLGWYLSTPGIWLGVAGICLLIWKLERKTAVLVAIGVLFSVIYLWNVRANPHQIYVMRRYVPTVAPFFMLAAAVFISLLPTHFDMLDEKWRGWRYGGLVVTALLGVLWLVSLGWSARGFIRQVDNQDVLRQLALIEREIPPNSVLLFNDQAPVGQGDFWGTPLKYIFGHDAFAIRDLEKLRDAPLAETVESWQLSGRTVIWIGDPQWLSEQGFNYRTITRNIASRQLEGSYEHKPVQVNPVNWQFPMSFIEDIAADSE